MPSVYKLFEASDEFWKYRDEVDSKFNEYVGNHWNYIDGKRVVHGGVKPISLHHNFYDWYKATTSPSFDKQQFILCTFKEI